MALHYLKEARLSPSRVTSRCAYMSNTPEAARRSRRRRLRLDLQPSSPTTLAAPWSMTSRGAVMLDHRRRPLRQGFNLCVLRARSSLMRTNPEGPRPCSGHEAGQLDGRDPTEACLKECLCGKY